MIWPTADLDTIARLRVLAAALPGAFVEETEVEAPFASVWDVAADLEHELPQIARTIRSLRPLPPDGPRFEVDIVGHFGLHERFEVVLDTGWCVMQSRRVVGGMAAAPAADGGTRFAFLGALRGPFAKAVSPLGRPIGRGLVTRLRKRVEATR
ncbi:hypothetical protein [Amycolatopsis sp. NPDC051903]|uniref:hypothetical protein n=1 Tax=Amycolatopsis sp. NPDC051903 TaxID=3363936 RepID=UPI0037A02E59